MCLRPVFLRDKRIAVPCGKCIECNIDKARVWAYRIALEASQYKKNCMVTLTYNDEHLPVDRSVNPYHLQLFLKRLRKKIYPRKVRFFACGEYGAKRLRPHYHVILFGEDFEDKYFFKNDKKGNPLFISPTLNNLWSELEFLNGKRVYNPIGYAGIVDVTFEVAKYVAIYLQKPPVDGRLRPFVRMSNRPGIGFNAIREQLLVSDKLYLDGKYIKLPRYFLKVLDRDGFDLTELKERRFRVAALAHQNFLADNVSYFREVNGRIKKFEKIFGKRLDRNLMV